MSHVQQEGREKIIVFCAPLFVCDTCSALASAHLKNAKKIIPALPDMKRIIHHPQLIHMGEERQCYNKEGTEENIVCSAIVFRGCVSVRISVNHSCHVRFVKS